VHCEEMGYTHLLQEQDECFSYASRWCRPGSPLERTRAGLPSRGLWPAVLDQYDTDQHHPVGNARRFVSCFLCDDESAMRGNENCENFAEDYLEGTRGVEGGIRSMVPAGDEVCFEGSTDYMETVVANVRRTPMGVLFESELSEEDCQARGFDRVRDMLDECWPGSRKFINSQVEEVTMINWIGRYASTFHYDASGASGGLWNTLDWISCSCDLGGAVRDRGMWQTMHGGDAAPYTDVYCRAMNFPDFATLNHADDQAEDQADGQAEDQEEDQEEGQEEDQEEGQEEDQEEQEEEEEE